MKPMNKRGVEMSMQTIVIAVIVLLIAVVLIMMVLNATGKANKGFGDCTSKGGQCTGECQPGEQPYPIADCGDGMTCCVSRDSLKEILG